MALAKYFEDIQKKWDESNELTIIESIKELNETDEQLTSELDALRAKNLRLLQYNRTTRQENERLRIKNCDLLERVENAQRTTSTQAPRILRSLMEKEGQFQKALQNQHLSEKRAESLKEEAQSWQEIAEDRDADAERANTRVAELEAQIRRLNGELHDARRETK